jgi:hypothetical protein
LATPYFDALITGLTDDHAPREHTVLELLDVDGKPGQLFGRRSWQYGNGTVMHPERNRRCWLPYLLPVPATPDRVEVR